MEKAEKAYFFVLCENKADHMNMARIAGRSSFWALLSTATFLTYLLSRSSAFTIQRSHPQTLNRVASFHPATTVKDDEECDLEALSSACLSTQSGFVERNDVIINQVFVAQVESLRDSFESYEEEDEEGSNKIRFNKRKRRGEHVLWRNQTDEDTTSEALNSHVANMEYNQIIEDDEVVLLDAVRKPGLPSVSRAFLRAGPRKVLHFDPQNVNAAIVTCGGLCPGLNNVIRELVHSLYYLYDANAVYGIMGGFNGFHDPQFEPVLLTNDMVANIHHDGGTILRSSRGGFEIDKILDFLKSKKINQLYIIGGDGTHRGAYAIHQACQENNLNVAVCGIPKTIDNDVDYIDRSFGFQSAVEAAQAGIRTAKTEAMCNVPNGIGLIKLMGRSAGFLAAFAALGSGDVDLVLIPEVPIVLEGPDGILPFLRKRVKEQKYAVVVVAEGAGEELLGVSEVLDASGNRAQPKIGEYISQVIQEHFASNGEVATIKYIDPSYTVRSVPANGADSLYCLTLAQNAVHGCMAGMTGFSAGQVNQRAVYLPIPLLVATSPRSLNPHGLTWQRILSMTGQPNTAPPKPTKKEHASSTNQQQQQQTFPALPDPIGH
jgi:6-phosphofructokinase 1